MNLSKLKSGDRGVITQIVSDDSRAIAKLTARGITPGTFIGVIRAGDPILIGIERERWALNLAEATVIEVDLAARPARGLRGLLQRFA